MNMVNNILGNEKKDKSNFTNKLDKQVSSDALKNLDKQVSSVDETFDVSKKL